MMSDFVKVARVDEIPDPGKLMLELDDRLVVLIRVADTFYCVDDVCTHDGGPLGEGLLEEETIACPRHGAKFCIKTGEAITMPATEATIIHEVKAEDGEVFVRLSDD